MHDPAPPSGLAVEHDFAVGKLRLVAADADARLAAILGFAAPGPGRFTGNTRLACLRLGPHEWLLLGEPAPVRDRLARLGEAFADDLALILDMSHGGHLIRLSGPSAIERLTAYCELDLRPASFPTGCATRTRFGDIAVTLARLDDVPSFWVLTDQSHADYVALLLDHGLAPV